MTKCKSCVADIIWITTEKFKKMPLDAKPIHAYVFTSLNEPVPVKAHVSHFATCPKADRHRKKKGGKNHVKQAQNQAQNVRQKAQAQNQKGGHGIFD